MFNYISGRVDALRDLWLVGDTFLYENFSTLVELKSEAHIKKIAKPYVYNHFNVTGYVANPLSDISSVLARILNALILRLNDTKRLPRLLTVIPDCDILDYIDFYTSGKSHVIGTTIEWLVNNIDRAITCKKEDLKHIRPGAVAANEPKVIWVKMLARSANDRHSEKPDPVNELASTFNYILEEILATRRNNFILDVAEEMQQDSNYTIQGRLTGHGKVKFWRAVNKILEKFDRYEISL